MSVLRKLEHAVEKAAGTVAEGAEEAWDATAKAAVKAYTATEKGAVTAWDATEQAAMDAWYATEHGAVGAWDQGENAWPPKFLTQSENTIVIANGSDRYDVRVCVAPNKDWVIADMTTTVATTVAFAVATEGTSLGAVPTQIKTIREAWQVLKLAKTCATVAGLGFKVAKLLDEITVRIPPGEKRTVLDTAIRNPLRYIDPSGWGAIYGASDVTLMVFLWDPEAHRILEQVQFNSNSDTTWVVDELRGVARSSRQTPAIPARGFHSWQ
jgi:hypothetical protein